jgi:hypothetical protein
MIVNNVTAMAGVVSLQDAARVRMIHNTIANNDSTATAGEAFLGGVGIGESTPQPAGIVSYGHSTDLAGVISAIGGTGPEYSLFSNPQLVDNIIWQNRSFYYTTDIGNGTQGLLPNVPSFWDLAVIPATAGSLDPEYCILTDSIGYDLSNISEDPQFVDSYFNTLEVAAALDEGGNFVDVRFDPLFLTGDYHITAGSEAINAAIPIALDSLLDTDFDGDPRASDIGADEFTDTVTILKAEYNAAKQNLIVTAVSSASVGTVTLQASYDGGATRLMTYLDSKGFYRKIFKGVPPTPASVTVTSSGGGSDTESIPFP